MHGFDGDAAIVGFVDDMGQTDLLPGSGRNVTYLSTASNINMSGVWVFRIDKAIAGPCESYGDCIGPQTNQCVYVCAVCLLCLCVLNVCVCIVCVCVCVCVLCVVCVCCVVCDLGPLLCCSVEWMCH